MNGVCNPNDTAQILALTISFHPHLQAFFHPAVAALFPCVRVHHTVLGIHVCSALLQLLLPSGVSTEEYLATFTGEGVVVHSVGHFTTYCAYIQIELRSRSTVCSRRHVHSGGHSWGDAGVISKTGLNFSSNTIDTIFTVGHKYGLAPDSFWSSSAAAKLKTITIFKDNAGPKGTHFLEENYSDHNIFNEKNRRFSNQVIPLAVAVLQLSRCLTGRFDLQPCTINKRDQIY